MGIGSRLPDQANYGKHGKHRSVLQMNQTGHLHKIFDSRLVSSDLVSLLSCRNFLKAVALDQCGSIGFLPSTQIIDDSG